jgi:uncharacterized protein with GYD domain
MPPNNLTVSKRVEQSSGNNNNSNKNAAVISPLSCLYLALPSISYTHMSHYLIEVSYTPEAWMVLTKNPQNRIEAIRPAVEKLGGKVENGWFSFGEYDVIVVLDMPDNVAAAAIAMAFAAGGALKTVKTTPLLTAEEALEAMRRGAESGYKSSFQFIK